ELVDIGRHGPNSEVTRAAGGLPPSKEVSCRVAPERPGAGRTSGFHELRPGVLTGPREPEKRRLRGLTVRDGQGAATKVDSRSVDSIQADDRAVGLDCEPWGYVRAVDRPVGSNPRPADAGVAAAARAVCEIDAFLAVRARLARPPAIDVALSAVGEPIG